MNDSRIDLKAKKMCQFKGIPPYYIPKWRYMCLNNKLPMLKNVPEGAVNLYLGDGNIGSIPWIKNKNLDFNLWDPKMLKLPCDMEYDSLRDPYLKCYFSNSDRLKTLYKQGLITREGKTITDLRNYNKYRRYLHDINLEIMKTIQRQTECDSIKKAVINTAVKKKKEEQRASEDPCGVAPLSRRYSEFLRQELKGLCDRAVFEFKKTSYFSQFPDGEQDCLVKFKEILLKDIKKKALLRLRKLQDYEDNQNDYWCEWLKHTKAELQDRADELIKGKAYNFERCKHIKEYEDLIAYKRSNQKDYVQAARKMHKRKQMRTLQTVRQHVCRVTHRQYPLSATCPYDFFEGGTWETACPYQEVVNDLRDKLYCEDGEYEEKKEMLAIEDVPEEEKVKKSKKEKEEEKIKDCKGRLVNKKTYSTSVADHIVKGVLKNALALTVKHLRLPFVCQPNTKSKIRNIRNTYFLQEMMGGVKDELARLVRNNLEDLRKLAKSNKRSKKSTNNNTQMPDTAEQADLWRSAPLMRCGSSTMIGRYVREQLLQIATKLKQEGKKGARFEKGKYDAKFESAIAEVTAARDVYDMSCQLIDGKLMVCQCSEIINIFNEDEDDEAMFLMDEEDEEEEEELNETEKELKKMGKAQKKESPFKDLMCCDEEDEEEEEEYTFESVKNETGNNSANNGNQLTETRKCAKEQKDDLVYNLIASLITSALIILRDSIACRAIDTEDIFNLCALVNRKSALGEQKMMCKEVQKLIQDYSNQLMKNRCMNLLVKETVKKIRCNKDSAKADEELSKSILCATKKFVSKVLENLISEIKFSKKTEEDDEDEIFKDEICSDKTESVCSEDYGGPGDDPQSDQQADEIASVISKIVPYEDSFTAPGAPDEPDSVSTVVPPLPPKTPKTPSDQQLNYLGGDSISKLVQDKKSPVQRVSPDNRDNEPVKATSFEKEKVEISPDSPKLSIKNSLISDSINAEVSPSSIDPLEVSPGEIADDIKKSITSSSKAKTPSGVQKEISASKLTDKDDENYRVSLGSKAKIPSDVQKEISASKLTDKDENYRVSLGSKAKMPSDVQKEIFASQLKDKEDENYRVSLGSKAKIASDLKFVAASPEATASTFGDQYNDKADDRVLPGSRAKTLSDLPDDRTSPNSPASKLGEEELETPNYKTFPSSRAKSDLQDGVTSPEKSPEKPESRTEKSDGDEVNERVSPNSPASKLDDNYPDDPNVRTSPRSKGETPSDLQDRTMSPKELESKAEKRLGDEINERFSPNSPASKIEDPELTNLRTSPSSKGKTSKTLESRTEKSLGDEVNERVSPNSPASKIGDAELPILRTSPSGGGKTPSDLQDRTMSLVEPESTKEKSYGDEVNQRLSPDSPASKLGEEERESPNYRTSPSSIAKTLSDGVTSPEEPGSRNEKCDGDYVNERVSPNSPASKIEGDGIDNTNAKVSPSSKAQTPSDLNSLSVSPEHPPSIIKTRTSSMMSGEDSINKRATPCIAASLPSNQNPPTHDGKSDEINDRVSPSTPADAISDLDEQNIRKRSSASLDKTIETLEKNKIVLSEGDLAPNLKEDIAKEITLSVPQLPPNTPDKTLSDEPNTRVSPNTRDMLTDENLSATSPAMNEGPLASPDNATKNESVNNRTTPDLQDRTLSDLHDMVYSPSSPAPTLKDIDDDNFFSNQTKHGTEETDFVSHSDKAQKTSNRLSPNTPDKTLSDVHDMRISPSSLDKPPSEKDMAEQSQNESNNNRTSPDLQDRTLSDIQNYRTSPTSVAKSLSDLKGEFSYSPQDNFISTSENLQSNLEKSSKDTQFSPNIPAQLLLDENTSLDTPMQNETAENLDNIAEQSQNGSNNNRTSPDQQDQTLSGMYNTQFSTNTSAHLLTDNDIVLASTPVSYDICGACDISGRQSQNKPHCFFNNPNEDEVDENDFVSYSDKAQKTSNCLSPNTPDKTLSDVHDMKMSPTSLDKDPNEKKE